MTLPDLLYPKDANFYQLYLVPKDSEKVIWLMRKAGELSKSDSIFQRRFVTVACAVAAVFLSAINAIIYLIRIPFKILVNIVSFTPMRLFTDLINDISDCARSGIFAACGAMYVGAGVVYPAEVFPYFAPAEGARTVELLLDDIKKLEKQLPKKA